MNTRAGAYLAALMAAVLWGGNFVAVRMALIHFDAYLLTGLRFFVVAAMIPLVKWPKVPFRTVLLYAACSGIGLYLLSTVAIDLGLTPGVAALLMQFQVFFSLGLSWLLLREVIRLPTIIGTIIGLAGLCGVLITGGSQAPWFAVAVCLAAAFGWAVANIIIKRYPGNVARLQCATGLICLPLIWLSRDLLLPTAPPMLHVLAQTRLASWLPVIYVTAASFIIAQILWGHAVTRIGVAATAPVALLIPIAGVVLAWLLLGQQLNTKLLISAGIVLVGVGIHIVAVTISQMVNWRTRSA